MVLRLQGLLSVPLGSFTGKAQSPEKPELGKKKEALDQVCLTDPTLTQANRTPYTFRGI